MYPRIRIVLLVLVAALGVPASASAEVVLRRMVYGELTEDRFGGGLAPAGDADGDGSPDFAIIANRGAHGQSGPRDRYYVVSGSDLRLIRRIEAAAPFNEFHTVSAVGDWDDDGEDDLFVREDGELSVRRGRTGERLHVFPSAEISHGERVVAVGDMNGDAVPDLAIGDWSAMNPDGVRTGRVDLISGADYTTIRTLYGERADDEFGFGVGGGCDVNADGTSDVFVGAPGFDHSILGQTFDLLDAGKAYVYSGADGSLLHASLGDWTDDGYSRAFSCVGDVEGDGVEDFMIGNPGFSFFPLFPDVTFQGSARLYSGKTGALLRGFTPNPEVDPVGGSYGGVIVALGDFDGAGEADVLIGADGGPFEIRTAREAPQS
ncbi:MAG: integrin alpha, partial [Candidatus Methylomirabilis sp.]|nr:integrin alpha [Deltaproteobacteria bacterium]